METISIAYSGICSSKHPIYRAWSLSESASKYGFEIVPIDSSDRELHLEVNYSFKQSPINLRGVKRENTFLLALEPRAVLPLQYKRFIRNRFGKVLVTSPFQRILDSDEYFDYGFLGDTTVRGVPEGPVRRSDSVALLNANKASWVKGSGYSKRRSIARILSRTGSQVSIGGAGWNSSLLYELSMQLRAFGSCIMQFEFPSVGSYQRPLSPKDPRFNFYGSISDAKAFLERHTFCLVVENDVDYLSEKLFQALEAGCVPLYWGPSLEDFNLPAGIAIQLKNYSAASLASELIHNEVVGEIRTLGKEFLSNPETRSYWSHKSGVERLFQKLRESLDRI